MNSALQSALKFPPTFKFQVQFLKLFYVGASTAGSPPYVHAIFTPAVKRNQASMRTFKYA